MLHRRQVHAQKLKQNITKNTSERALRKAQIIRYRRGPQTTAYFEIKKPPWVSVVWVVIACCICSKHDSCIYAARNAQSQRGKIFATQKSFDGASEASGVLYQQRNTSRRSERSERSLISNKKPVATERTKRAEFSGDGASEASGFLCNICNKHYVFIIEI